MIEITRFNSFVSIYWVSEVQDWLNIPVVYIAGLDWQQASIQNYGGALEASMERFNKLKLREPQDTEKSIWIFFRISSKPLRRSKMSTRALSEGNYYLNSENKLDILHENI